MAKLVHTKKCRDLVRPTLPGSTWKKKLLHCLRHFLLSSGSSHVDQSRQCCYYCCICCMPLGFHYVMRRGGMLPHRRGFASCRRIHVMWCTSEFAWLMHAYMCTHILTHTHAHSHTYTHRHTGSSTVSTSFALLRQAELQLKDLVRKKFAEAVQEGNTQDVERYDVLSFFLAHTALQDKSGAVGA